MTQDDIRAHLDALAKPRGSMGRLEDIAVALAMTQDRSRSRDPPAPDRAVRGGSWLRRGRRVRLALRGDGDDGRDDPGGQGDEQRAGGGA